MFRGTNSPFIRSTFDCIYSFWYNTPTMLPTGATAEMELILSVPNNLSAYSTCWLLHCASYQTKEDDDVNNQEDATTFSFINLFNSALHVSGDKFALHQEHFLTVYTAFGTMHRQCCRPVSRLRWNLSPETCRAEIKRLMNEKVVASCWLFTSSPSFV